MTVADLGETGRWGRAALPVTVTDPANSLEFRTWWYGSGDLDAAEIRIR